MLLCGGDRTSSGVCQYVGCVGCVPGGVDVRHRLLVSPADW